MEAKQRRFLDKRLREHATQQPEILALKKMLLTIGGEHVVALFDVSPTIVRLTESGFIMDYPDKLRLMEESMCHANSAKLFTSRQTTAFGTGFALSSDGLWREHSWGIKRQYDGTNRIIETTEHRERYFGVLYWGAVGMCAAKTELRGFGIKPVSRRTMKRDMTTFEMVIFQQLGQRHTAGEIASHLDIPIELVDDAFDEISKQGWISPKSMLTMITGFAPEWPKEAA